nr:dihydropteroate synthase [Streptomyces purpurogeneiscleroticus]
MRGRSSVGAAKTMRHGGVDPERIIVDPGLGFAKNPEHDVALLAQLHRLRALGRPLLVAASRKRFLGRVLAGTEGNPPPTRERDALTAAVSAIAAHSGVWTLRVHEVRATADAVRVARAVESAADKGRPLQMNVRRR